MPTVFEGRVFHVTVDPIQLPGGRELRMEAVRHPGSVVLVPMPDPDHVVLIRQYRYVIDRWIWELPAGTLHAGEPPEEAAARECAEETRLVPGRLEAIGSFFPSPGFCDELMHFYRLTDLSPAAPGSATPDEDEQIEPQLFTLDEARALLARGDIVDMKTVCGLALIGVRLG
ncbi:MAG: NUDIX hydrolase [Acidobacteriota bacterium]|nr:NUDIX hydrolase [Acidobacteriota bacterium]